VLVVRREYLLQDALGARVDRVADYRNVALRVAAVNQVFIGLRVVDIPVFLDRVALLVLVVECLLDFVVAFERRLVDVGIPIVCPILFRVD
jgi:hypothetical protein